MAHDEAYYQAEKKIEDALKPGATESPIRINLIIPYANLEDTGGNYETQ